MFRFSSILSCLVLLIATPFPRALLAVNSPTFNRDIAPIVFGQCVVCHHPDGVGPFSLTNYREVKKRAKLIARVTASHYMPPWPPEPGTGPFIGERRLNADEIGMIARWARGDLAEGAPADLPPIPPWPVDWQLGKPDLIATLPAPYPLPADGKDVYRNFVLPNVVPANRFVRAVELRPGDTRAIHHSFILLDETGDARRLDKLDAEPGFPGMIAGRGARMPGGFLSWQPGRGPVESPSGMSWLLPRGADLVLQLHLRPTGKPEFIQPSIGLYFTQEPPTRPYQILLLRSTAIDIPAGAGDYAIEAAYQLPVDVSVIGLLPHMHYLGKTAHGWAELPDGTRRDLLLIKDWDFNWQGDYRHTQPVALPQGSTLKMRYTFDNSTRNVRNPNHPPKRVQYGLQSSDEMGELWFWLETKTEAERATLQRDYDFTWALPDTITQSEALLRRDAKDAATRTELGASLATLGRSVEALEQLRQAVADDPNTQRAWFVLGTILLSKGRMTEAEAALTRAVALSPDDADAQTNLGSVLAHRGKIAPAIACFEAAVRLKPDHRTAREGLQKARARLAK